jgi:hypothetical protein
VLTSQHTYRFASISRDLSNALKCYKEIIVIKRKVAVQYFWKHLSSKVPKNEQMLSTSIPSKVPCKFSSTALASPLLPPHLPLIKPVSSQQAPLTSRMEVNNYFLFLSLIVYSFCLITGITTVFISSITHSKYNIFHFNRLLWADLRT